MTAAVPASEARDLLAALLPDATVYLEFGLQATYLVVRTHSGHAVALADRLAAGDAAVAVVARVKSTLKALHIAGKIGNYATNDLRTALGTAGQSDEVARCQHVSPTPWGLAQCVLERDHNEQHAYSPSESEAADLGRAIGQAAGRRIRRAIDGTGDGGDDA